MSEKKKIPCISGASARLKSSVYASTINPKDGSATVSVEFDEVTAKELAAILLAVACDKNWRGRGKLILTAHKSTNQVTVLRRD